MLVCGRMDDVLGLEFVVEGEEAVERIELEGADDPVGEVKDTTLLDVDNETFKEVKGTILLKFDCAERKIELVPDGFTRENVPGILVELEAAKAWLKRARRTVALNIGGDAILNKILVEEKRRQM